MPTCVFAFKIVAHPSMKEDTRHQESYPKAAKEAKEYGVVGNMLTMNGWQKSTFSHAVGLKRYFYNINVLV